MSSKNSRDRADALSARAAEHGIKVGRVDRDGSTLAVSQDDMARLLDGYRPTAGPVDKWASMPDRECPCGCGETVKILCSQKFASLPAALRERLRADRNGKTNDPGARNLALTYYA